MPIWVTLLLALLQMLLQLLGTLTPAIISTYTPAQKSQMGAVGSRCLKAATAIGGFGIPLTDVPSVVYKGDGSKQSIAQFVDDNL